MRTGISRCDADVSGDAGLIRTQQRGSSRWPLSAFSVPSSPEGHVNGQNRLCVVGVVALLIVDVCTEESGMTCWCCVCSTHFNVEHFSIIVLFVNDKMLLTVLLQVTWIWFGSLYAATRVQTKVFLVLRGPPSTAPTFCHPEGSKPVV